MVAEPFQDRRHAGRVLARAVLEHFGREQLAGAPVIVFALPRGGTPVGFEVARALGAPLDVFVVRKLRVPSHPELAMGAVASGRSLVLNEQVISRLRIAEDVVQAEVQRQMDELQRREADYRGDLPGLEPEGGNVLLVDDGVATGASLRAAAQAVRTKNPAMLTLAVPVAPYETALMLRSISDAFVCPIEARRFFAVGQWYADFDETSDEEVRRLLTEARAAGGRLAS